MVAVLSPVPLLKEWSIDGMRMSHAEGLLQKKNSSTESQYRKVSIANDLLCPNEQ